MKFDGTTWQTVGTAGFSADTATYTSLAFNGSTPYVTYSDGSVAGAATLMKFDGTTWQTVGTAGFSAGGTQYNSLKFSGSTPYVAYTDAANANKVTVMNFYDPSAPVGSSSGSANGSSSNSSSPSTNSNSAETPNTGYGTPAPSNPIVTLLIVGATTSTGAGLALLYRQKSRFSPDKFHCDSPINS
jgi:hypothetical protein